MNKFNLFCSSECLYYYIDSLEDTKINILKNYDKITMHNKYICYNCNPNSNSQYVVNGKINRPYAIKFCEKCNCETTYKKNNKIIL